MNKLSECENNPIAEDFTEKSQPILDDILAQKVESSFKKKMEQRNNCYPFALIGLISTIEPTAYATVSFTIENRHYNYTAISTVELKPKHIGKKCVIVFNQGNIEKPIVTGLLQQPKPVDSMTDENTPLIIHSESGIIIKCGSSRIELTEDGTINIQGMHINSQAYGPHRIKGGSVKIN